MPISCEENRCVIHIVSGDLWGGAEVMAFNLITALKRCFDLTLYVIILNEGRLAAELRRAGIPVEVIDEKCLPFWKIVRRTRTLLRKLSPDLIHSHRYKENFLAALAAAPDSSIQLIATQHGLPETAGGKATLATRLVSMANFHLLARYFTNTVAVSEDIRSFLVHRHAFKEDNVESIHNGVEIPAIPPAKPAAGKFVVGSSGRLVQVKDYPLMVEICRAIVSSGPRNIHFELAGEGPERTALESLLACYGMDGRFTLRGHLHDMNAFYRGIDIYLNTSLHEGIPMTILEALARGIPVVAPAVGGIGEIITNGVEGFLIDSRNPDEFADKCLLLTENAELRARMSRAARARAKTAFSTENMAERYYRLYQQSVKQPRKLPWQ